MGRKRARSENGCVGCERAERADILQLVESIADSAQREPLQLRLSETLAVGAVAVPSDGASLHSAIAFRTLCEVAELVAAGAVELAFQLAPPPPEEVLASVLRLTDADDDCRRGSPPPRRRLQSQQQSLRVRAHRLSRKKKRS